MSNAPNKLSDKYLAECRTLEHPDLRRILDAYEEAMRENERFLSLIEAMTDKISGLNAVIGNKQSEGLPIITVSETGLLIISENSNQLLPRGTWPLIDAIIDEYRAEKQSKT